MAGIIVRIQDLKKVFQRNHFEVIALDGINLEVKEGEFLALMGPSGSGKTTLLNLIGGLDKLTSGKLTIGDVDIAKLSEDQLTIWRTPNVGFIFQLYNLIPVLTAYENVELPLLLLKLSKKERKKHALIALKLVGLEDRLHHYPGQLSGGEQQRVGIARAIVTDPKIILADEPTGDLDAQSAADIMDLLRGLNKKFNKTIIMVTHDPTTTEYTHQTRYLSKGLLVD